MGRRLTVLYDGWCPLCVRAATWWKRLDTFGALELVSFRDPQIADRIPVDLERAERRMICISPSGRHYEGIDALIQVTITIPALWMFVPFLLVARALGFGQRLYDFVASRRIILPVHSCSDGVCKTK